MKSVATLLTFSALILLLVVIVAYAIFRDRMDTHDASNTKGLEGPRITEHHHKNYVIYEISGLLTHEECDTLVRLSKNKGLQDSQVWSFEGQGSNIYDESHRNSKQAWVSDGECEVAEKLSVFASQVSGLPMTNQEHLQVVRYDNGGRFNEHYDVCDHESKSYCEAMNNKAGERVTTLLVYLNDDYEGGETEFVNIGVKVKPEKGKGILFWNIDDQGKIIPESRHRGNPVTKGEKWICNKWTHELNYPL